MYYNSRKLKENYLKFKTFSIKEEQLEALKKAMKRNRALSKFIN